jgi:hypothetical protein
MASIEEEPCIALLQLAAEGIYGLVDGALIGIAQQLHLKADLPQPLRQILRIMNGIGERISVAIGAIADYQGSADADWRFGSFVLFRACEAIASIMVGVLLVGLVERACQVSNDQTLGLSWAKSLKYGHLIQRQKRCHQGSKPQS